MDDQDRHPEWAARPWILAALGGLAGLLIWWLVDRHPDPVDGWQAARAAAAVFVGTAVALFGFTFERLRPSWSILFSIAAALIAAFITYANGPADHWGSSEGWRLMCIALAIAIAAPLFQTARDQGARRFPYVEVHGHAWTNVVIGCAAWMFAGIVFLLAWLLAELFGLIRITFIQDLMGKSWFNALLLGAALGAAIGLLRERDRIVRLLQRVVVTVLAVLAPVLAIGLVAFLASLPFTGLAPLWETTQKPTQILLGSVIGALILANAVIGNSESEESRFPPLRWGALALAVTILPFAAIAAVSTGTRIGQYGLTPERLWAGVFVGVAVAYGIAYLAALGMRRLGWAEPARRFNLWLAFGLAGLALLLATPLVGFNAISTHNQIARLAAGKVSPDAFSWSALAFEFGDPGRAALERLAETSADAKIRSKAAEALKATSRWTLDEQESQAARQKKLEDQMRVLPQRVSLPPQLLDALKTSWFSGNEALATLIYRPGEPTALLIVSNCETCSADVLTFRLGQDGTWSRPSMKGPTEQDRKAERETLKKGDGTAIEIREVKRRQLFINGRPVGENFE